MAWKDRLRRLAARAGWSVHRWPSNRFDAPEDAFTLLRRAGFVPGRIIDGGSNAGQFASMITRIFPEATLDLIEPQSEYWPLLNRLAAARARTRVHKVAITEPGVMQVGMHRGGAKPGTGAFVIDVNGVFEPDFQSPATTLDALSCIRAGWCSQR